MAYSGTAAQTNDKRKRANQDARDPLDDVEALGLHQDTERFDNEDLRGGGTEWKRLKYP